MKEITFDGSEFHLEKGDEALVKELTEELNLFLISLKENGRTQKTIQKYKNHLCLFGYELVKHFHMFERENKTLKDFIDFSCFPGYLDGNPYTSDVYFKKLESLDHSIEKFWDFYRLHNIHYL